MGELSADELAERWTLETANWQWLANKSGATRLGSPRCSSFLSMKDAFPATVGSCPNQQLSSWLNRFMCQLMLGASIAGKDVPSSITVLKSAQHWAFVKGQLKTSKRCANGCSFICSRTSATWTG